MRYDQIASKLTVLGCKGLRRVRGAGIGGSNTNFFVTFLALFY